MARTDILLVALGSTAGLRAAEAEFAGSLRRAGATVEVVTAQVPRELRTFALTDLVWARAARRAALDGIARSAPRSIVYSTMGSALLWPAPGAIRYDAPAAANRPGRHGLWQRPVERRRLQQAPLLIPQTEGTLDETPGLHAEAVVVPIPVEPSGPVLPGGERDIAAITYAANPEKKGLDRVLVAWAAARLPGEELVVCGTDRVPGAEGVVNAGRLEPEAYRALLRRARVFIAAARREDYGLAQLEALADGCRLVTTASPGPYAALEIARSLDARLVVSADPAALGAAVRAGLESSDDGYDRRARLALAPFGRAAVDEVVATKLLPRLLP